MKDVRKRKIVLGKTSNPIQEDGYIFMEKIFKFNLVEQNSTSLSETEIFVDNVISVISSIRAQNGVSYYSTIEGYGITDLVLANLAYVPGIYVVDAEESIKVGDWIYIYPSRMAVEVEANVESHIRSLNHQRQDGKCSKIIACFDPALTSVPKLPEAFVDKYINRWNKNDKIESIGIEYTYTVSKGTSITERPRTYYPRVRKDNTVIVSKVKQQFSLGEVVDIIIQASDDLQSEMIFTPNPSRIREVLEQYID